MKLEERQTSFDPRPFPPERRVLTRFQFMQPSLIEDGFSGEFDTNSEEFHDIVVDYEFPFRIVSAAFSSQYGSEVSLLWGPSGGAGIPVDFDGAGTVVDAPAGVDDAIYTVTPNLAVPVFGFLQLNVGDFPPDPPDLVTQIVRYSVVILRPPD